MVLLLLHATKCAYGIVVYPEPPQSRGFWSKVFHIESNLEDFASSRASNSRPDHRSLPETAEERHIDLGRTDWRSGPERSAHRTCCWHFL